MGPNVVQRASELSDVVDALARARDEAGILSLTVGLEPGSRARGIWEIELKNDLARLADDETHGRAVRQRLSGVEARLEELLDPALSGRGRALYLGLGSELEVELFLHDALPTAATVGPVARLLPLLAVAESGAPSAFLVASRDQLSICEHELGAVLELERLELEPWVGDWWPEMKGATRANPLRGQQTVSHRDRYERRLAEAYRHTHDEAAERLASLAEARDWTRAVVAGEARQADALAEVLRRCGARTAVLAATLEGVRRDEADARLRAALAEIVETQMREWVDAAKDEAGAGGRGACGAKVVLEALAQARVDRLLVDPTRSFRGAVAEGGVLTADAEPGQAVEVTDLLVVRALETDAAVTPVQGDATAALGDCEGIAALLRW